jgi:hypothetical protein
LPFIIQELAMPKTYDRDYFDKWYRDPKHAVGSPAELKRKVAMVVAHAEYYLGPNAAQRA